MVHGMREKFEDRGDLTEYLAAEFPGAARRSPEVSETRGGRAAAEARLAAVRPERYAKTRGQLDGAVTRLSQDIRHGVLGIREVREKVQEKSGARAEKLVQELGWHDYFQRVYREIGGGVWEDREEWKTGFGPADYSDEMPEDLLQERTGLVCMDSFARDLRETGYLHNHVRLWVAAYLVHHRMVHWRSGARWFLEHLLDGDPASNNLSWQWAVSTFSHKPYFFDRGNLENNTGGVYCAECPLSGGGCPFDAPVEELEDRLFPHRGSGGKG